MEESADRSGGGRGPVGNMVVWRQTRRILCTQEVRLMGGFLLLSCRDLGNSNITGQLGPELGQLQHLQYLELYRNNFEVSSRRAGEPEESGESSDLKISTKEDQVLDFFGTPLTLVSWNNFFLAQVIKESESSFIWSLIVVKASVQPLDRPSSKASSTVGLKLAELDLLLLQLMHQGLDSLFCVVHSKEKEA
ncbi:hypothetical protein QJS04_geneDACA000851 [Acorus gramineus]|uniref:Uncharacterized protein n=1 Tax=Acorus gramineus TaxID=55184 RepID=A0AAV9BIS6_ACOGR|nr:hypothetical protein QJS04_geneDACA000851 [Acorus gramineus]